MIIKELFRDKRRLENHLCAPMLDERERFLQFLKQQGRNDDYLRRKALWLYRLVHALPDEVLNSKTQVSHKLMTRYISEYFKEASLCPKTIRRVIRVGIDWFSFLGRYDYDGLSEAPTLRSILNGITSRSRLANAPLLQEREYYLSELREKGYSDSRLKRIAYIQLYVLEEIPNSEKTSVSINDIRVAANKHFEKYQHKGDKSRVGFKREFIHVAKDWLSQLGTYIPEQGEYVFKDEVESYLKHLLEDVNCSVTTINGKRKVLKFLMTHLSGSVESMKDVHINHIDDLLMKLRGTDICRRTLGHYLHTLSHFFIFASGKGWCDEKLALAIKTPRIYRQEDLPYSPSENQVVNALHYYQASDKKAAIRNHAIMLILAVYGMRTHELVNISLDDINWADETLVIHRAKGERVQVFPLSASVGNAIVRYIKEVRVNSMPSRTLFQCLLAPFRPITHATIYPIVSKALKDGSKELKHYGPHALRHWTATHLINQGFSLYNVSRQLGHECQESTKTYAKVDLKTLRKVAQINWEDVL